MGHGLTRSMSHNFEVLFYKLLTSIPRSVIWTAKLYKSKKKCLIFHSHRSYNHNIKNRHSIHNNYPNITAFQSIMLLSCGAPLTPAGGSCCNLLKSLMSLFRAGVDIVTTCNHELCQPECIHNLKLFKYPSNIVSGPHHPLLTSFF